MKLLSRQIQNIASMWLLAGLNEKTRSLILRMQKHLLSLLMKVGIYSDEITILLCKSAWNTSPSFLIGHANINIWFFLDPTSWLHSFFSRERQACWSILPSRTSGRGFAEEERSWAHSSSPSASIGCQAFRWLFPQQGSSCPNEESKEKSCWRSGHFQENGSWHTLASDHWRRCCRCSSCEVLFQVWQK